MLRLIKKNNTVFGVIIGLIVPFLLVGIIYIFIENSSNFKMNNDIISNAILFAMALDALLLRYYYRLKFDYTARGIMIAMFAYFFFWLIKYGLA